MVDVSGFWEDAGERVSEADADADAELSCVGVGDVGGSGFEKYRDRVCAVSRVLEEKSAEVNVVCTNFLLPSEAMVGL